MHFIRLSRAVNLDSIRNEFVFDDFQNYFYMHQTVFGILMGRWDFEQLKCASECNEIDQMHERD